MNPVTTLQDILNNCENDQTLKNMIDAKAEVLKRYQQVFRPGALDKISEEQFQSFLRYENNCHWPLHRGGAAITEDMNKLHKALEILLNESKPIEDRLNQLFPGGETYVPHLGKAILTAILTFVYPDDYGVWSGTSEKAAKKLGIWPNFPRGLSLGDHYKEFNANVLQMSKKLDTDLWTLDGLLWRVVQPIDNSSEGPDEDEESEGPDEETEKHFGLERHLHDFLFDNWEKIELGEDWYLYEEGGDIQGYGYECLTDIGKIDLLARHKKESCWLVIELKRGQTTDDTVGQVLRYMGWVDENLAEDGDQVKGMIIAQDKDEKLRYALRMTSNIHFRRYKINFELSG